jgi:hypothetical protein
MLGDQAILETELVEFPHVDRLSGGCRSGPARMNVHKIPFGGDVKDSQADVR